MPPIQLQIFLPKEEGRTMNDTILELISVLGDFFKYQLYERNDDMRTRLGIWSKKLDENSVCVISSDDTDAFISPMEREESLDYGDGLIIALDEPHSLRTKEKLLDHSWTMREILKYNPHSTEFDNTVGTLGVQVTAPELMIGAVASVVFQWVLDDQHADTDNLRLVFHKKILWGIGNYQCYHNDMRASIALRQP